LTTRVQARHRAAVRARNPLTDVSTTVARTAGGAARTGAVAAAAGGLLVSIALPASAAPATVESSVTAAVGASVPAAFGTTAVGVVSAPATATSTATAVTFASAPAAAPIVVAPVIDRAARSSDSVPVVNSSVAVADPAPVAAPVVAEVAAPAPAPVSLGQQILAVADDYAGVPYVYGGTTPSGFDCSGYTSYVYRQVGVEIPRTSNAQLQASARITRDQAVPGDLVFFTNSGGRAYHVGIYAGDNMMWDAPRTGKPVQLRAIWSDAVTFGRLAPTV
jgi:peptidoglycan DL-endopeptidase CwlO